MRSALQFLLILLPHLLPWRERPESMVQPALPSPQPTGNVNETLEQFLETLLDERKSLSFASMVPLPPPRVTWEPKSLSKVASRASAESWEKLVPLMTRLHGISWTESSMSDRTLKLLLESVTQFQVRETILHPGDDLPLPLSEVSFQAVVAAHSIVWLGCHQVLEYPATDADRLRESLTAWFDHVAERSTLCSGDHALLYQLHAGLGRWNDHVSGANNRAKKRHDSFRTPIESARRTCHCALTPCTWWSARRELRRLKCKELLAAGRQVLLEGAVDELSHWLKQWKRISVLSRVDTSCPASQVSEDKHPAGTAQVLHDLLAAERATGIAEWMIRHVALRAPHRAAGDVPVDSVVQEFLEGFSEIPSVSRPAAWRPWVYLLQFYWLWSLDVDPPPPSGSPIAGNDEHRHQYDQLFHPWREVRRIIPLLEHQDLMLADDPRWAVVSSFQEFMQPWSRKVQRDGTRLISAAEMLDALYQFYLNVVGITVTQTEESL